MRGKVKAEPIVCRSCGLQVLGRGGDLEGWKAVQMDPGVPDLSWYCMKAVCQQAYRGVFAEAQMIWAERMSIPLPEPPEPVAPPPAPPEPGGPQEAVEGHGELDQSELDQSSDQAASDQAPREPPPELMAFETSDLGEAGFKDEPFPYSRFESEAEEPKEPVQKPAQERYVPTGSPQAQPRFIRHEGTGEPDE